MDCARDVLLVSNGKDVLAFISSSNLSRAFVAVSRFLLRCHMICPLLLKAEKTGELPQRNSAGLQKQRPLVGPSLEWKAVIAMRFRHGGARYFVKKGGSGADSTGKPS